MQEDKSKLFKQRLFRVHISVGIIVSLLMYISIFFGLFTIFLPYIQVWEKPSRHFKITNINKINYSNMIDPVIQNPDFPKNNIIIKLPGYKNDPTLKITHRFIEPRVFNPTTEKKLKDESKNSKLSFFLNKMHQGQPMRFYGRIIYGFVCVAVMFLIFGGFFLIFSSKFNNNGKNQQSTFSKYHRKIFIWVGLPLLIVILTGALMNIGFKGGGPLAYTLSKGKESNIFKVLNPVLTPKEKSIKRLNKEVDMLPISDLIEKAKIINPKIVLEELLLINWKDKTARVEFKGYNPYKPFLNGIYNRPKVILSAVDGSLIKNIRVMDRDWGVLLTDSLYFLHLLLGVGIFTKLFMFLVMLLSCFAIGFAVMLWLEKKAKRFDGKIVFYHWMGKLSLAVMIGVIPATALLFNLQWILPFDMQHRLLIQESIFYISWLSTFTWGHYRINSYQAVKDFLFIGGFLFILASFIHFIISGFSPFELFQRDMHSILGVDIGLTLLGIVLIFISFKLPKERNKAKLFWNKNYKGLKYEK